VWKQKAPGTAGRFFCVFPLSGSGLARSLVNTRGYLEIGVTLSLQARACVFGRESRARPGPLAAGRPLCKCPPAPACGRHLLLYFAKDLSAAKGLHLRDVSVGFDACWCCRELYADDAHMGYVATVGGAVLQ
jgi:hypothetical protein